MHLLLADDDLDDCLLFQEALEEIPLSTRLTTVHNGEQLMQWLGEPNELPAVLFLDLNMPRKNGFECLLEIKNNSRLKALPVIIFSTSFEQGPMDQLYQGGAHYYIRKPNQFSQLKALIQQVLVLAQTNTLSQPARENFVLRGDLKSPEHAKN